MGKTPSKTRHFSLFTATVSALLFAHSSFAQGRKEIGTVVTTQGLVSIVDPSGVARGVVRRDAVHEGDVIVVAQDGFVSFRMVDNAHLSLGPSTEFAFDNYRYDGRPGTRDSVVMSLRRGCFRARVGTAGAAKRDEYRIETPVASINVDGSFHGATLVGDRLYTATWDGASVVSNAIGSLNLGEYGDHEFSRTLPGEAPTGLLALIPEAACEPPRSLDGKIEPRGTYRLDHDEDNEG